MKRIMGIDYGIKRTGIAVTDVLQIAVHGLSTIDSTEAVDFVVEYSKAEPIEKIVIGHPELDTNKTTKISREIERFKSLLEKHLNHVQVVFHDESFTSKAAKSVILASGARKKKRMDKALVDKISAVLILQDYLGHL